MNKTEITERIEALEKELAELKSSVQNPEQEIQKGQLCWLWDGDDEREPVLRRYERYRQSSDMYCHEDVRKVWWGHARPVTPEEIREMMPMFPEMQSTKTLFDWSEIPEEFDHAAIDLNGAKYAYTTEPRWDPCNGQWGNGATAYYIRTDIDPQKTLEKRPGA